MLKKIVKLLLCCTLIIPSSVTLASETKAEKNAANTSENVEYWREKIPSFDEYLTKNPDNKLIGEDEVYVKYTLKEDLKDTRVNSSEDIERVFNVEIFTKDEYLKETLSRATIGGFEPENGKDPYWLRLDLQVYEMPNMSETLMAHSFWEWKTPPAFRFEDLNGIYVSQDLKVGPNSTLTPMVSEYIRYFDNGAMSRVLNKIDTDDHFRGMMGIIDLAYISTKEGENSKVVPPVSTISHMGMTQTPITKVYPGKRTRGYISTNYVHKQVSFGAPSFDSTGKPSFGLTVSNDSHGGRVFIEF